VPPGGIHAGSTIFTGGGAIRFRQDGMSVAMIDRHYGTLLEGAGGDIARRLSAFDAEQERAREHIADEC
jgi:hypothetical protein